MSNKKNKIFETDKDASNNYINISKIKTENIDLDGEDEEDKNSSSPKKKSDDDRNQGNETVGIP